MSSDEQAELGRLGEAVRTLQREMKEVKDTLRAFQPDVVTHRLQEFSDELKELRQVEDSNAANLATLAQERRDDAAQKRFLGKLIHPAFDFALKLFYAISLAWILFRLGLH